MPYIMIITDANMPVMGGLEMSKHIRDYFKKMMT